MVPECNIVDNSMSLSNIVFAIRPVRLQGTDQKVEVFHRWTGEGKADLIRRGKKSAGSCMVDKRGTVLSPPHPSHARRGRVLAAMPRILGSWGQSEGKARWCKRSNVGKRDQSSRTVTVEAGSAQSFMVLSRTGNTEASLVVQWLGHCTSMQRAQVQSLIGELSPTKLHGACQIISKLYI